MNGAGRGISLASFKMRSGSTQEARQSSNVLLITKFQKEIIDIINSNHVTLISAETGSGKVNILVIDKHEVSESLPVCTINKSRQLKFHSSFWMMPTQDRSLVTLLSVNRERSLQSLSREELQKNETARSERKSDTRWPSTRRLERSRVHLACCSVQRA